MTAIAAGSITSRPIRSAAASGHGRAIMNAAEDWLRAGRHRKTAIDGAARQHARCRRSTNRSAMTSSRTRHLRQMARRPRADAVTELRRISMTISDRIRVKNVSLLSDRALSAEERRRSTIAAATANGRPRSGEIFDRGNAATLLPYNLASRTVVLVRQFRLPAYLNGHDDLLIEAAAGMLDDETPERTDPRRGRGGNRLPARTSVRKSLRSLHEPGRGHRETALLRRRIRSLRCGSAAAAASPTRARTSRCWSCRSMQALAMIADGRIAGRQDHHAAAVRGAEYFSVTMTRSSSWPSEARAGTHTTMLYWQGWSCSPFSNRHVVMGPCVRRDDIESLKKQAPARHPPTPPRPPCAGGLLRLRLFRRPSPLP